MRILIAFLAMLLCTTLPASPEPVDSSISGVYLAPDRVCNLTVSRPPLPWNGTNQTWWVALEMQCLTFAGQFRSTRNVLYVYTACPSFGSGAVVSDYSAAPFEFTSILAGNATFLDVVKANDYGSVANGVGTRAIWYRLAPLASPFPYSCANGRKG